MHQKHIARPKIGQQVFGATAETGHGLALEPRDPVLHAQIAVIVIEGAGDALRRVEVRETGGDDAVMDITPMPVPAQ